MVKKIPIVPIRPIPNSCPNGLKALVAMISTALEKQKFADLTLSGGQLNTMTSGLLKCSSGFISMSLLMKH